MIQANELRVGNWVNIFNIPMKIDGTMILNIETANRRNKVVVDLTPIPITEHILLKCGFKRDIDIVYRYYLTYDYSILLAYDLDDNCIRLGDSWDFGKITYIHELQNLYFALKKNELTLNL